MPDRDDPAEGPSEEEIDDMLLKKYAGNPILLPNPANEWENLMVLNLAVVYDEVKQEFVMLYRAAGDTEMHLIYLGLATSKDGIHFVRQSDQPVLGPTEDNADAGGVEDPRLVQFGEWYFLTYASRPYAPGRYWLQAPRPWVNPPEVGPQFLKWNDTVTYLAITKDFIHYKKLGRITDTRTDDRDVILFPETVGGQFIRVSRPMYWCGKGYPCEKPAIWIAKSHDLMEWPHSELLIKGEQWWETRKIGGGCPPIKTADGWILLYHGVCDADGEYRVGALLLDLDDPAKVIARTKDPIMWAEEPYEKKGFYNGCVFPTGNVVVGDEMYIYYGSSDSVICLATCSLKELTAFLKNECRIG